MEAYQQPRRYRVLAKVGEGSFGQVFRGVDRQRGTEVAVKKIRVRDVRVLPAPVLRELLALQRICHPNVISLLAFYTHGANLVLILPFMHVSLAVILERQPAPLPGNAAHALAHMLLCGLAACHSMNLIHRDIKPANLLIDAGGTLKLADFGQARLLPSESGGALTPQVATRWYRAPELLFGSHQYGTAVDMWAAGCVLAQLWTLSPLLPGNSDLDQIFQVVLLLGSPDETKWPGASLTPDFHKLELPKCPSRPLCEVLPFAPEAARELLGFLLCYHPSSRISAEEALVHRWLAGGSYAPTMAEAVANVVTSLQPL